MLSVNRTTWTRGWTFLLALMVAGCSTTGTPPAPVRSLTLIGHCGVGCPIGSSGHILDREAYTLSNNPKTKFADWVAYWITSDTYAKDRPRDWATDPDLPRSETLEPKEYDGAYKQLVLERGHQANLASMGAVPNWEALNYLSNITPQRPDLNQGSWKTLEDRERALRMSPDNQGVHVVTGPLYERHIGTLPAASKPHTIPSGYWKVIFTGSSPEQGLYASFVMDQDTPRSVDFCTQQVTVAEIERRSGLTLWSSLPADVQAKLKHQPGQLAQRLGCP
ncbi:DNA/RNA non-specific endonuclease [Pseudomonas sp. NPDC089401]|uniref:DNA/RNA non-specific endonuclease n=1 Tax=Pseudomonas sp. NPDC089401 TaxID=3364462 RepID=UPI00380C5C21